MENQMKPRFRALALLLLFAIPLLAQEEPIPPDGEGSVIVEVGWIGVGTATAYDITAVLPHDAGVGLDRGLDRRFLELLGLLFFTA